MSKTLVLAEKPSVGRDLARVLGCTQNGNGYISGPKYIVTWALGHLVTLADPEVYDQKYKSWKMEDLPMLPQKMKLVVIGQSRSQFNTVSKLLHSSEIDHLVIATDAGREGELVARWIMEKAGWKGKTSRLWISSQTDKAIKEGFASLKPAAQYDNLYKSAQSRAEADWLVGLNVTRALTCKYNAQLSAGRVQTPTLAMIVAREQEIRSFQPREYYTVSLKTQGFTANYRDKNGNTKFFDREKAQALADAVSGKEGVLTSVTREYKFVPPPAAYDLTELQRDANRRFAYSAKQTLSIMQRLYETHKVLTYPRTDSRYITKDVAATLPDRLRAVATGQYKEAAHAIMRSRPISTKYIVNDARVTDHHAIIPTEEAPDLYAMSGEERNIYDLVVRRFLAVLSAPAEYEEVKLTITVDGKHNFYARGKIMKNPGWKAVSSLELTDGDEDEEDKDQSLPALNQGQKLKILSAQLNPGKTKPPARFTEATLLTAMENPTSQVQDKDLQRVLSKTSGLGTPATRADIIEKLFDTFYVERRGKELVPTSKGMQLVSIVPQDLRSAELTARWEQQLTEISEGRLNDRQFVQSMRDYASKLVSAVESSAASYTHDNQTRSKCPDCGKYLLDVQGKRGRMLVCPDRECGYRKSVTVTTNARCPNCHKKMELRGEGEKKMFACACGYREKLSDFEKRKSQSGANKRDVAKYMSNQKQEPANSALADALAKWQAAKKD